MTANTTTEMLPARPSSTASSPSNMYANAITWNPFKGCRFACSYCKPSFQRQAKRQKHRCTECYNFAPHQHPDRLDKIPNAPIVFVCGNADISFCQPSYVKQINKAIKERNVKKPDVIYYLQSKQPACFAQYLDDLPANVVLVTTLETNRDEGYALVSKAPPPSIRYADFKSLNYGRKVVTLEPIMDFDLAVFAEWIIALNPEYVWLGFNSRPKAVQLPEPTPEKLSTLAKRLADAGIEVRGKELRGIELPETSRLETAKVS